MERHNRLCSVPSRITRVATAVPGTNGEPGFALTGRAAGTFTSLETTLRAMCGCRSHEAPETADRTGCISCDTTCGALSQRAGRSGCAWQSVVTAYRRGVARSPYWRSGWLSGLRESGAGCAHGPGVDP